MLYCITKLIAITWNNCYFALLVYSIFLSTVYLLWNCLTNFLWINYNVFLLFVFYQALKLHFTNNLDGRQRVSHQMSCLYRMVFLLSTPADSRCVSTPSSKQSTGFAKRKNQTIWKFPTSMSQTFWNNLRWQLNMVSLFFSKMSMNILILSLTTYWRRMLKVCFVHIFFIL